MNKQRRKDLARARDLLEGVKDALDEAKGIIEQARDEEGDYYDNMPESLQGSEKGQAAEAARDALDEALGPLEDLDIDEMVQKIEEAEA